MTFETEGYWDTIGELLHQDHYTPEELGKLLGMSAYRIRHAVRDGELRAFTVDHHVLGICREDVVQWLAGNRT